MLSRRSRLPPTKPRFRARGIACISGQPSRILDLGCGTGSSTLPLARAFPDAQIVGLDLSPYMLVYSEHKAQCAPLPARTISWQQGLAERTSFDDASFDLVTASFLLHELPPEISRSVLPGMSEGARPWRTMSLDRRSPTQVTVCRLGDRLVSRALFRKLR